MTKIEITHSLESLFARIKSWPPEWQEYVVGSLRSIEEMKDLDGRRYLMTEEEQADLLKALRDDARP